MGRVERLTTPKSTWPGFKRHVGPDEAGQIQVDLGPNRPVEDQDQSRRLVARELGRVDDGLDDRLGAGRDVPGPDPDVGAAALGPPGRDMDFLVGRVDQLEGVVDLRPPGDGPEVVRPLGETASVQSAAVGDSGPEAGEGGHDGQGVTHEHIPPRSRRSIVTTPHRRRVSGEPLRLCTTRMIPHWTSPLD